MDNHQSWHTVASVLCCDLGGRASSPRVPHLASCRVYSGPMSPWELVSSYLTFSPLPLTWRYISVALFLRSPWLDVIKCTCSMMLGLSSPPLGQARLSSKLTWKILAYTLNFVKAEKLKSFLQILLQFIYPIILKARHIRPTNAHFHRYFILGKSFTTVNSKPVF